MGRCGFGRGHGPAMELRCLIKSINTATRFERLRDVTWPQDDVATSFPLATAKAAKSAPI